MIMIRVVAEGQQPEEINHMPETAPSKRILKAAPNYGKKVMGPLIAEQIGVEKLCQSCKHFQSWIQQMMALE